MSNEEEHYKALIESEYGNVNQIRAAWFKFFDKEPLNFKQMYTILKSAYVRENNLLNILYDNKTIVTGQSYLDLAIWLQCDKFLAKWLQDNHPVNDTQIKLMIIQAYFLNLPLLQNVLHNSKIWQDPTFLKIKKELLSFELYETLKHEDQINIEKIRILLTDGADPNFFYSNEEEEEFGDTSLITAATYDNQKLGIEIIELLLQHGADINYEHKISKATALEVAQDGEKKKIAAYLIAKGGRLPLWQIERLEQKKLEVEDQKAEIEFEIKSFTENNLELSEQVSQISQLDSCTYKKATGRIAMLHGHLLSSGSAQTDFFNPLSKEVPKDLREKYEESIRVESQKTFKNSDEKVVQQMDEQRELGNMFEPGSRFGPGCSNSSE